MRRRDVLKGVSGVLGMSALSVLPTVSLANPGDGEGCEVDSRLTLAADIARNHGHEFQAQVEDLILFLREARDSGEATVDIQGSSRHPHTLFLNQEMILQLLIEGSLQVNSSEELGHVHAVSVQLSQDQ